MATSQSSLPNWHDAAAYAPLLEADRSFVAWEWLRRDSTYCEAAAKEGTAACGTSAGRARQFGLVAFEPPQLCIPNARPLWCMAAHPFVLGAQQCRRAEPQDLVDLSALAGVAKLVRVRDYEYLLLSDGFRAIRLDGPTGTFSRGVARLVYSVEGLVSAEPAILTLRRFLALARTGRFSRLLHRPEARARRWILMLRATDALLAGATQREIAVHLLSRSAGEKRWRSREPSLRTQAQRLVRSARRFAGGEWRTLLY